MLLRVLATFCIASVTGFSVLDENYLVVESDADSLQWPERYSIKAIRASLLSNIVEDYTAWKTNQSSRMDYNQGAVKSITILPIDGHKYTLKYEIHPETTEEVLNQLVCHSTRIRSRHMWIDEILPSDSFYYEAVDNETIDELETVKFEHNYVTREEDKRLTIWAYYVEETGWIPVRYEVKEYNPKLGSLIVHDVWTFSDFTEDFDEEVFDPVQNGCNDEATKVDHTWDSEKITKELMFINSENEKHVDYVFNHFKTQFERKYAHELEHALRKVIFRNNMRMISSINRRNLGYKLGVNEFSDWTPEELERSHGTIPRPKGIKGSVPFPYEESDLSDIVSKLPKQFDLRDLGVISPVKHQGTCGSCWTFAAAAVTESGLARINGGRVLSLSNQAIVDCAYEHLAEQGGGGCNGGFDFAAYDFIMKHGLPTEQEYGAYKNRDGFCNIGNMTETYKISGWTEVMKNSKNAMKVALVNHGPLFIYIHVSMAFHAYSNGIFYQNNQACPGDEPNHGVTLVGYGELDGERFWIIKNSWGETWGIDGYMLVAARDDVCGIMFNPSYPVF